MKAIESIHHLSATVGDPQENYTFYKDVLGLKLVKKTVNFEDKSTYHLYFANQKIEQGSIMTFFPRTDDLFGRVGAGQVRTIAFAIPRNSRSYWAERLHKNQITFKETKMFGEITLEFNDPHGLTLALIETEKISEDNNVSGFYGVELLSENPAATTKLLLQDMELTLKAIQTDYYFLEMKGPEKHKVLINRSFTKRGRLGIGTVHHIAWSVVNKEELASWKNYFEKNIKVTAIKNRKYFYSAYLRDPGHIIYELATVGPGFLVDEPLEELGSHLMLPEHFEADRDEIEAQLPPLE